RKRCRTPGAKGLLRRNDLRFFYSRAKMHPCSRALSSSAVSPPGLLAAQKESRGSFWARKTRTPDQGARPASGELRTKTALVVRMTQLRAEQVADRCSSPGGKSRVCPPSPLKTSTAVTREPALPRPWVNSKLSSTA